MLLSVAKQAHIKLRYSHTVLQAGIWLIEYERAQTPKLLKASGLLSWKVIAFIGEAWWLGSYLPTHLLYHGATWGRWVQLTTTLEKSCFASVCSLPCTRYQTSCILNPNTRTSSHDFCRSSSVTISDQWCESILFCISPIKIVCAQSDDCLLIDRGLQQDNELLNYSEELPRALQSKHMYIMDPNTWHTFISEMTDLNGV